MSVDRTLLRKLLQIEEPWAVREYRVDGRNRRCDVWIGIEVQRGWFGIQKKNVVEELPEVTWRHVPFGNMHIHVHVSVPVRADISKLAWVGDEGLPFTRALARQVFAMFNEGVSLRGICALLDIPLNDVWRYRFALDNGKVGVKQQGQSIATPSVAPVSSQPTAAAAVMAQEGLSSEAVPDVSDPIWMRLIAGDQPLDIRVLSLKLLLTRVRSQLEVISDDEVRMLKLRELHRYFVKNERMLGHELSQMRTA